MGMIASLKNFAFHCTKCGACCSYPGMIVNVTPRDVRTLVRYLKVDASALLKVLAFYQVEPNDTMDEATIQERMVFPALKTHKGLAFLGLLKQPSGQCLFLKNNKCSIYPARPRICQSFPFTYKKAGNGMSTTMAKFAAKSCPGIGQGENVNVEKVKETGRFILKEIDEMLAFARWWNNRPSDDLEQFKPKLLVSEMAKFQQSIGKQQKR